MSGPNSVHRVFAGRRKRFLAACAGVVAVGASVLLAPGADAAPADPGAVVSVAALSPRVWTIPGADVAQQKRIVYRTVGPGGRPGLSSGAIFLPTTPAPRGGYPVLSWAHGTVGIGNQCAPTIHGPVYRERDNAYLSHWLRLGYAVVASDYYGLGTYGVDGTGHHPYGDAHTPGFNVIDMVRAAHSLMPETISTRWAAIGQSQGGQASVAAASEAQRYAPDLRFVGSVSTGLTGYFDRLAPLLIQLAPKASLPVPIEDATAYVVFTLAGVDAAHPELDLGQYLSPSGKRLLAEATTTCDDELNTQLAHVQISSLFAKPISDPRVQQAFADMQRIPTSGFTRPLFIGEGYFDDTAVYPVTASLVNDMRASGATVEFRGYPSGHDGTMAASLPDSTPFLAARFRAVG
ncbi:lipase family protein [Gordonia sp. NPDC003425]